MEHLELDGASGGGQLLRSALSLSLCTGIGFTMDNIRSGRPRPGLMRQHLTAVQAACTISQGCVDGATPGSTRLRFEPGAVVAGHYEFQMGTAGSTMLVLQTVLPALWQATDASQLRLEGGTHNPFAPSADFVTGTYLPALRQMGVEASLQLHTHGFYPAGGGVVSARVEPCPGMQPCDLHQRGRLVSVEATALVSALSPRIGQRELAVLGRRLGLADAQLKLHSVCPAIGPGNALVVRVEHEHHVEVFTGFGERRVPAEKIAERLASEVDRYLASGACVAGHLADQLLLPMALAGGGGFTTSALSDHLRTNAALIEKFLPLDIAWEPAGPKAWQVTLIR